MAWSSCWLHRSPAPDVVPGYVVHVKTTAGGISEYVAPDGISVLADDPPVHRHRCTTCGLRMVRGPAARDCFQLMSIYKVTRPAISTDILRMAVSSMQIA